MNHSSPTILFVMAAAIGHLNCTFSVSRRLRKEGYRVIYAIHPDKVPYLEEQGFEAIPFDAKLFSFGSDLRYIGNTPIDTLLHRLTDHFTQARIGPTETAITKWNKLLQTVNPQLLFLDSFYPFNYLLIEGPKPPTIFINIMLSDRPRTGVPPLNSLLSPAKGAAPLQSLRIGANWFRHSIRQRWREWSSFGQSQLGLSRQILAQKGISISACIDTNKAFYPAVRTCPEIVLGPAALDYDELSPVEQLYLASPVHIPQNKTSQDPRLHLMLERLEMALPFTKWIYCSLGTLNARHNMHSLALFRALIRIFAKRPDWELILATGEIDPLVFGPQRPNIHLFRHVPQYQILQSCSAMITHGGINSVLECIHQQVPMLVFPLNNEWDQNGNAARVVHYGLGIRQQLEHLQEEQITTALERLISETSFKDNLNAMQARIEQEDNWPALMQMIKEQMASAPTLSNHHLITT